MSNSEVSLGNGFEEMLEEIEKINPIDLLSSN